MELAFGMILISALLLVIFDFALIIQTKTETMMMARNGVRYLVMQGIDIDNAQHNVQITEQTKKTISGLYKLNHNTRASQEVTQLGEVTVENITGTGTAIKDGTTGANAVSVKVCEVIHPLSRVFGKNVEICSSYAGFHSSQYKG